MISDCPVNPSIFITIPNIPGKYGNFGYFTLVLASRQLKIGLFDFSLAANCRLSSCNKGSQNVDYQGIVWRGGRAAEGNGLLNRRTGERWYREFESRPLRFKESH